MPVRDAIATIRRDPKWKSKVGIGLLVNLVPYVGMFALRGWLLDHERSVAWGVADGLPEWGDWTERAKNGLFGMLPGLVYSMVASLLLVVPLSMGMGVAMVGLTAASAGGDPGLEVLAPMGLMWVGFIALIMIESVLILPLTAVPGASYALYRDLNRALRFKTTWRQIRAGGRAFRRAWGFGAAYMALVLTAVELPLLPVIAAPFLADSLDGGAIIVLVMGSMGVWMLSYVLVLLLAIPAALVQSHLWAEWARESYGLADYHLVPSTPVAPAVAPPVAPPVAPGATDPAALLEVQGLDDVQV